MRRAEDAFPGIAVKKRGSIIHVEVLCISVHVMYIYISASIVSGNISIQHVNVHVSQLTSNI